MGRANVIAGLVTRLQGISGFDEEGQGTVVAYDDRVLSTGVPRAIVVLANRGEGERQAGRMGGTTLLARYTWSLDANLYVRHAGDVPTARADADTYTQRVVERVLADPTLGGSAIDCLVTETQVEDEAFSAFGPTYLLETLTVRAVEQIKG